MFSIIFFIRQLVYFTFSCFSRRHNILYAWRSITRSKGNDTSKFSYFILNLHVTTLNHNIFPQPRITFGEKKARAYTAANMVSYFKKNLTLIDVRGLSVKFVDNLCNFVI
jgi:hypothetical protein